MDLHSPKIHRLKTVQPYFDEVEKGFKNFEVRKNDRDFKPGEYVILQEFKIGAEDPFSQITEYYTGREIPGIITYVLKDFPAIDPEYVVFGFSRLMSIPNSSEIKP